MRGDRGNPVPYRDSDELGRPPPGNLNELTEAEARAMIDALMIERGGGARLDEESLESRPGPR